MGRLAEAIARRAVTRDEVFDLARQDRFTGQVTFHFRDGQARQVALGAPIQAVVMGEAERLEYHVTRNPLTAG